MMFYQTRLARSEEDLDGMLDTFSDDGWRLHSLCLVGAAYLLVFEKERPGESTGSGS